MRRWRPPAAAGLAAVFATALLLAAPAMPAAGDEPAATFTCNRDSVLTLAGLDTSAGTALFSLTDGGGGWLLRVPAAGAGATYRRAPAAVRRFAGSVGPGPVFALTGCGDGCYRAVLLGGDAAGEPLGQPFRAQGAVTAHTTYDAQGTPWVVLHRRDGDALRAQALRLEGELWRDHGEAAVRAVGPLAALPAPDGGAAVVSGTVRFAAGETPRPWVAGLPALPAERQGELLPVTGGGAAYLDAGGEIYLSSDAGATWQKTRWTPWGIQQARLWQPGRDYGVDLPAGDRGGPLALAWFDRRRADRRRLLLTAWEPQSGWRVDADLAPEVSTLDGALLSYDHLLQPRPGSWLLLTGCVNTAAGPGLSLRTAGADGLSKPRWVPLAAGE